MKNGYLLFGLLLWASGFYAQVQTDLIESVPIRLELDERSGEAKLRWTSDTAVSSYNISLLTREPTTRLTPVETVGALSDSFELQPLPVGRLFEYHIRKRNVNNGREGIGIITISRALRRVEERGRFLLVLDDTLAMPLAMEVARLTEDIRLDGWTVDTLHSQRSQSVVAVKERITNWHEETYPGSQAVLLLGRVPVPYSGNTAYDAHNDHQGAWSADSYYAEMDGTWTDVSVNNTTPRREVNKNVPGDGKFDQSLIPGDVELEVGRVDFFNMPAFEEDEIELTRKYLNKNHAFRIGEKDYPRRAMIENNFRNFDEGFGQNGLRNFVPMFGAEAVSYGQYDTTLDTAAYLCSYACGGGSYTSMSGLGNTQNLWVAKDIKTVFTLNFGSYFGDWDSQNNFLRGALGSGDVLANAWAGRPVWYLYPMALGQHLGYCTKLTQNARGSIYSTGFGGHSTHIALMGDPTLRLHPVKPIRDLSVQIDSGDIRLDWLPSPDADLGYLLYRKIDDGEWELLEEELRDTFYVDACQMPNRNYEYQLKSLRLEKSASGTYYNTSQGVQTGIFMAENPFLATYFLDQDRDGFGTPDISIQACERLEGYSDNMLDCDDEDPNINPDAEEIPNNDIDEDCNGTDLMTATHELGDKILQIFPNPTRDYLFVQTNVPTNLQWTLYDARGQQLKSSVVDGRIDLSSWPAGIYWFEVVAVKSRQRIVEKIIVWK
ncbi:MAG: T9SS type A sorting domain-containing protein [Bacteroidota bacterium]